MIASDFESGWLRLLFADNARFFFLRLRKSRKSAGWICLPGAVGAGIEIVGDQELICTYRLQYFVIRPPIITASYAFWAPSTRLGWASCRQSTRIVPLL